MSPEEQFDRIEAYLLGEMPMEEAQAFEQELAENPELAKELAMHRLEHDAMEVLLEQDLREQVKLWDYPTDAAAPGTQASNQPPAPEDPLRHARVVRLRWIAAVATLAATIAIGVIVNREEKPIVNINRDKPKKPEKPSKNGNDTLSPEIIVDRQKNSNKNNRQEQNKIEIPKLRDLDKQEAAIVAMATDQLKSDDPVIIGRGSVDTTAQNPLNPAKKAYQAKNYAEARTLLNAFKAGNAYYNLALEYKAYTWVQEKKYTQAAEVFLELKEKGIYPYNERAAYHLLLCRLTDYKNQQQAIDQLANEIMASPDHDYAGKTKALMTKLRQ